jgi:hypothetical protein
VTVAYTLVSGLTIRRLVKAILLGKMEKATKAIIWMARSTDMVSLQILMAHHTKANGLKARCMEKASRTSKTISVARDCLTTESLKNGSDHR